MQRAEPRICSGDDAASAWLCSLEELVDMLGKNKFAFDHEKIIRTYLLSRNSLSLKYL
ncbi:MAG: hypothetical protein Q8R18_04430 [bacterium]|nr:hypothetical protein [bacterium]